MTEPRNVPWVQTEPQPEHGLLRVPDSNWRQIFGMSRYNCDYVYVVAETDRGPSKIGVAKNPVWRHSGIQAGNPRRIKIYAAFLARDRWHALGIEAEVLKASDDVRLVGEWMDLPPASVISLIERFA